MLVNLYLIFAWGVQGQAGFNVTPQAISDTTSQLALSPYLQMKFIDFIPGVSLEGSWRGIFQDTLRYSRASSRFLTGSVSYKKMNSPISFRLGRQFSYLGLGGLIDGVTGKIRFQELSVEILAGKRAPSIFSSEEGFFKEDMTSLVAFQVSSPVSRYLSVKTGYGREFRGDTIFSAPLWLSLNWMRKVTLRGEIYYDMETNAISKASIVEYGKIDFLLWSFGYRYHNPWWAFRLLGLEDIDDPAGLSKPIHRVEGTVGFRNLPLGIYLGGWSSLFEDVNYSNLWARIKWKILSLYGYLGKGESGWQRGGELYTSCSIIDNMTIYASGSLIDEPTWRDIWIKSLRVGLVYRLPSGGALTGEIRLWANPEVENEVQGYLGIFLPFSWRSRR